MGNDKKQIQKQTGKNKKLKLKQPMSSKLSPSR